MARDGKALKANNEKPKQRTEDVVSFRDLFSTYQGRCVVNVRVRIQKKKEMIDQLVQGSRLGMSSPSVQHPSIQNDDESAQIRNLQPVGVPSDKSQVHEGE